jgi:hypothetical protein
MKHILENNLSPAGQEALKLIRALRRLPETDGTVIAEKQAIKALRIADLKIIALILAEEEDAQ